MYLYIFTVAQAAAPPTFLRQITFQFQRFEISRNLKLRKLLSYIPRIYIFEDRMIGPSSKILNDESIIKDREHTI